MPNSRPLNTEPPSATLDGLNDSRLSPFGPPSGSTATMRMRNGITDTPMIVSCVRTDTCTPTMFTTMITAEKNRPHTHHGRSMPMWESKNTWAWMPTMIPMPGPPRVSAAKWYAPAVNTAGRFPSEWATNS